MDSNIDPNSDFLTNRPSSFLEPLDPAILTNAVWVDLYQTPGAVFPTSPVLSTGITSPTAVIQTSPTPTSLIASTVTNTGAPTVSPTNTFIYYPPAPTNTPKPIVPPTNTPIPSADLAITKDDGVLSYLAGRTVTYTITVINNGPNNVTGAVVTDNIPTQVANWTWVCAQQNGGATGCDAAPNNSTNFTDTINLPNGASIVYTVTANISGGATGNLVNTAAVNIPAGYTESSPSNNSSTDTDTLTTTSADLSISKNDGVTTIYNGDTVTYTVRVTNSGPSNVTGAILSDPATSGLSKTSVACSGTPSLCAAPPSVAQLESGTFALPTLSSGQFYEITISANVTSISGTITNTATVTAPVGVNDPNTANNSASDMDTVAPKADLQITKTDNSTDYAANALKAYVIKVTNAGPSDVTGASVTDLTLTNAANPNIFGAAWSCTSSNGGSCSPGAGTGNINNTVNLPSGSSITYTVLAVVVNSPSGPLANTATVTEPGGVYDPNGTNNSATDTDTLLVPDATPPGIGVTPDGTTFNIPAGTYITLQLGTPVAVNGHASWDLIYYELPAGIGINMDVVILQVGNGSNWYTILNWGDGSSNTGTNIVSPPGCATEPDNCPIDASLLYNSTGIAIDLDGIVPNGTYPYIRIFSPSSPLDTDGQVEVDAIEVLSP